MVTCCFYGRLCIGPVIARGLPMKVALLHTARTTHTQSGMRRSASRFGKLDPAAFYKSLVASGHGAFFGVPDSLLKDLCACITAEAPAERHVIAANEGNAVGLACGFHMATRAVPVVYLQNSGLGNTVNPILSLAHRDVYRFPMLLLVGWRGDPGGKKDEPQHVAQGRLSPECLAAMEVPFRVLGPESADVQADAAAALGEAAAHFKAHDTPFALLIKRDTFSGFKLPPTAADKAEAATLPSREVAIEAVLGALADADVVVGTTGMPSRELFECRARAKAGHHRDFLTVGGMGHASSIAAGLALGLGPKGAAKPGTPNAARNVVVLDGDGGALMHLGAMPVIGGAASAGGATALYDRLLHVVVNNGAHDSVGGQPTVGRTASLPAIAVGAGYHVVTPAPFTDVGAAPAGITAAVKSALAALGNGKPVFLEVPVKKGNRADLGRPTTTPLQNKEGLMDFLAVEA